jgi:S1-C subfamily serine protease
VVDEGPLSASNTATGLTPYDIYEEDAPGVVLVRADVDQPVANPFESSAGQQPGVSTGSGFEVDSQGDILTNYHVIAGARSGGVSVEFEHGVTKVARVVGEEPDEDLAILRVDAQGLDLNPLELGDSATTRVGDPTLAIGDPFGLDRTLSSGIVSALQRQITAPSGFAIDNVIQTDAPLDPTTSGGPLIDAAGLVIGVNSEIETSEGASGTVLVSFAIPINTVSALLRRLRHVAVGSK